VPIRLNLQCHFTQNCRKIAEYEAQAWLFLFVEVSSLLERAATGFESPFQGSRNTNFSYVIFQLAKRLQAPLLPNLGIPKFFYPLSDIGRKRVKEFFKIVMIGYRVIQNCQ